MGLRWIVFILLGFGFGATLYLADVISWKQINDMFHFRSFHMYGVIGSAVVTGWLLQTLARKAGMKNVEGESLRVLKKDRAWPALILGGILFGIGWAITGACPGPLYILVGAGHWKFLFVLTFALAGVALYGILKKKLPH